jgi:hypothetical protein
MKFTMFIAPHNFDIDTADKRYTDVTERIAMVCSSK